MGVSLVDHARRELELLGEEPETIELYLTVVRAFEAMGHSGVSHYYAVDLLKRLIEYKNITPITDDPDEWDLVPESISGSDVAIWQNVRAPSIFSHDGGKTYHDISEAIRKSTGKRDVYISANKEG